MRNFFTICVSLSLAVCLSALSWGQQSTEPDQKLVYKTVDDVTLHLNVFLPPASDQEDSVTNSPVRRSAIVFFFGGGWVKGTPDQFFPQCRALADQGMVAFSAEYRIKNDHGTTPFECVKDAKSAIRWVRSHADQLMIAPDRIAAAGGSAGGHIAACTGLIEKFNEPGENNQISSVPNAMILFNPVLDTTKNGYGAKRFNRDQRTMLSPCHHVGAGVVPTLVMHGDADKTVPWENAQRFTKLMQEAGNVCTLVTFPGRGHGFFNRRKKNARDYDKDFVATLGHCVKFLTTQGFIGDDKTAMPKGEN